MQRHREGAVSIAGTWTACPFASKATEPPRPPRLEHVRDLWQMHRPQRPQQILTASIYETDAGRELRVGFSENKSCQYEFSVSQHGGASTLQTALEKADLKRFRLDPVRAGCTS